MSKRAGISSGKVFGDSVKAKGAHVINRIILRPDDFRLGVDLISGVGTALYKSVVSGIYVFGWRENQSGKASTVVTVPSNVPTGAKANVNVYWAAIDSGATVLGGAVLDLDYRVVNLFVSGNVAIVGQSYTVSGTTSNVTATHSLVSGTSAASQTLLQKTTLTIPAIDIEANSLLLMNLFRDSAEAADFMESSVNVIAVEVEFVDA